MNRPTQKHRLALSLFASLGITFGLYLLYHFRDALQSFVRNQTGLAISDRVIDACLIALWLALAFVVVRALNEIIFGIAFRKRRGYAAPDLIRNIFSLVAYTLVFALIFQVFFQISLGAIFTTSAVFGVILGLALQSTLGNLFAGISFQADKPFQVGDVISVDKWTGVVESITWRGVKLRTFLNHVVLISNTTISNSAIEVAPRGNLNARIVSFDAIYNDSPVNVIQVIREAVREADNVSRKMTPVVRIKNFGESGVDYEVKYLLNNYATYNDTDALVRQRIWYAFQRAGITFSYPTRTIHMAPRARALEARAMINEDRIERLTALDIFAPLSAEQMRTLANASASHIFAPGEIIIRAGDAGTSMYVVHRGRVSVERPAVDGQETETIATLREGDFFGEMGLFTGQPRAASVISAEETEVLEISHDDIRRLFETNPHLVEAVSGIIAERREGLAALPERDVEGGVASAGLLTSIRRFFRLG
ncbi:MAG: mechanosensitive ion channel family protein [Pyrinomonadaceae bacterium]